MFIMLIIRLYDNANDIPLLEIFSCQSLLTDFSYHKWFLQHPFQLLYISFQRCQIDGLPMQIFVSCVICNSIWFFLLIHIHLNCYPGELLSL